MILRSKIFYDIKQPTSNNGCITPKSRIVRHLLPKNPSFPLKFNARAKITRGVHCENLNGALNMSSQQACQRKVKYTKAEAAFQVKVRPWQGSYYRCRHCGHYHVTRMPVNFISDRAWNELRWERMRAKLLRRQA
jgi:hypothetical protein